MADDKRCWGCKLILPLSAYAKKKRNKDGLQDRCKDCCNAYRREWGKKNGKYIHEYGLAYHARNQEYARQKTAAWQAIHRPPKGRKPNKTAEELRKRRLDAYNNNIELRREQSREWAKSNPDRRRAQHALRKATKIQATPSWANQERITEIYFLAAYLTKSTGVPYHVDHLVPLRHPLVCGLHCEANLWPIPAVENIRKRNTYWPNMP